MPRLDLIRVGRQWMSGVAALPFLVSALWVAHGLDGAIVLGTIYFLGPFNLLLHAPDGIPGTGEDDGASPRARLVIVATNVPLLAVLVLMGGATVGIALLLAVVAAVAWAEPPLRLRDRPVLDVISGAAILVLPAVTGFLVAGVPLGDVPWLAVAAFGSWAAAACCLLAIRDAPSARAAGRSSMATALGPRTTALAALVGFGLTAALAATSGRAGALAALGLDLYLLPPAMVLLSRPTDRAGGISAGGRAWAGFRGLNWLVGLWLGFLWLRYTWIRDVDAWEIAAIVAAAVAGYGLLNVVAIRIAARRRNTRAVGPDDIPSLTVIIPTRDEAQRLPETLAALTEQTYADATVVVVDDDSSDGTAELAATWLADVGQVVVAPPLPDGWTGRAWASQVGADASTGDLLLFVEADTILTPVAIRILVEQLQARRLDLLSGLTRYGMTTRAERIAVPGHPLLLFGFMPIWLSGLGGLARGRTARSRLARSAFAYGPCLLVRRTAYEAAGGHGANPGSLRDDVDLARAVAASGGRVGVAHATDLAVTRHFVDAESAVGSWRRTFLLVADGSLAVALATVLLETMAWIVPLVLPVLAWISGADPRHLAASFAPLLVLGALRVTLAVSERHPFSTVLWHPVTVGLTLFGQLAGIVDHVTGRPPRWRGRVIEPARSQTNDP